MQGYARLGIGHQRTVHLNEQWLLLTDEVSGAAQHALDLRFVLGPEWRASSEVSSGETVSCVIAGPRRLTLVCEAESRLALSYPTCRDLARIRRRATRELYPNPHYSLSAGKNADQSAMGLRA